ncbi:MAG: hypothetical protein ABIH04_02945 [Planctomycetota bacterium]
MTGYNLGRFESYAYHSQYGYLQFARTHAGTSAVVHEAVFSYDSMNLYNFVNNNPINYFDSYGESFLDDGLLRYAFRRETARIDRREGIC